MASSSTKSPASMNVEAVLRMKEGVGETSYAQNSSLQKRSMDSVKQLVTASATDVYLSLRPGRFTMADLGCSSGANALGMVEDIIRSIAEVCGAGAAPSPEFSVLLNDLPTNDFNTTFSGFPEFAGRVKAADVEKAPLVFLSGVPGSFYGRLFPTGSVHLVCSFSSLHWLSQIPPGVHDQADKQGPVNKGKMFISSTSPPEVPAAYQGQFRRDFSLFLESRAAEVVAGGRMVLSMLGREADCCTDDDKTTLLWDLLSDSLAAMVEQGLVEQGKVDSYDVPFYPPCIREIEEEVRKEGSFALDYAGTFEYQLNPAGSGATAAARMVSMAIRAIQESMLNHHFGPAIIDPLFAKYAELIAEVMERQDAKGMQLGLVLLKL